MLTVENISKSYKQKHVLQNISFTINDGEVVGLVGENGAGKSTLLNLLATVIKPDKGQIELNGIPYNNRAILKEIGFVPQELSVWEELSVEDNMKFFAKLSWRNVTLQQCRNICLQMQLTQWKEKVSSLSGGMKRKLNMAISLIHDPKLILLDEPTVGIDLRSKDEIGQYLMHLAKNEGKTIIYTSHDMNEIEQFCDRIYIIGQDPYYYDLLSDKQLNISKL